MGKPIGGLALWQRARKAISHFGGVDLLSAGQGNLGRNPERTWALASRTPPLSTLRIPTWLLANTFRRTNAVSVHSLLGAPAEGCGTLDRIRHAFCHRGPYGSQRAGRRAIDIVIVDAPEMGSPATVMAPKSCSPCGSLPSSKSSKAAIAARMLATSQEFNAAMPAVTRMRPPSPVCRKRLLSRRIVSVRPGVCPASRSWALLLCCIITRRAQVATARGCRGVARSAGRRASLPSAVRTSRHRVWRQRQLRTSPRQRRRCWPVPNCRRRYRPSRQAALARHRLGFQPRRLGW